MNTVTQERSNDSDLEGRLKFLGLDSDSMRLIRNRKKLIEDSLEKGLDRFYEVVAKTPRAAAFFSSKGQMKGAKQAQIRHWATICAGVYDEDYVSRVRAIGSVHARIGLDPRWYIGGYALISEQIVTEVLNSSWPKAGLFSKEQHSASDVAKLLSAVLKSILLDMDLSISVHIEEAEAARKRVEMESMATVQKAVTSFGEAISRLGQHDLTARITDDLPEEYASLKASFNAALNQLDDALSQIRGSAEGIASGSREVRTAADDLSRRAEQQAASVEEMSAAVEQITAAVKSAATRSADANALVTRTKTNAEQSGEIVGKATLAMGRISQSSEEIAKIITVIDEIAFQTNLLALNAGVEAARAGEAGKGFAVVAQEVRELAQRSAGAAKDINQLIVASGAEVKDGVALVGQVGSALGTIVSEVQEVATHVMAITELTREQSTALQDVNSSVLSADQGTQQNAAMAEELTASSHSLGSEVDAINRLIAIFRTQAAAGAHREHGHENNSVVPERGRLRA
ncbi:globin-coupled sensor protein [Oricola nitratireducens]|uniref:globin-coupled sensor protein n=1 Tax=Oricola nitratireducens TaxID=2775868 RepID=UPI00186716FE|nr:globin-coupled sensor protein [Oricola nitratireducens]